MDLVRFGTSEESASNALTLHCHIWKVICPVFTKFLWLSLSRTTSVYLVFLYLTFLVVHEKKKCSKIRIRKSAVFCSNNGYTWSQETPQIQRKLQYKTPFLHETWEYMSLNIKSKSLNSTMKREVPGVGLNIGFSFFSHLKVAHLPKLLPCRLDRKVFLIVFANFSFFSIICLNVINLWSRHRTFSVICSCKPVLFSLHGKETTSVSVLLYCPQGNSCAACAQGCIMFCNFSFVVGYFPKNIAQEWLIGPSDVSLVGQPTEPTGIHFPIQDKKCDFFFLHFFHSFSLFCWCGEENCG